MADADTATMHIDGAARGNPGPSAYAVVLARPGLPVVEEAAPIGTATNNVAEYTALVKGLELAVELGVMKLEVFSDSELMVKQMSGEYRVKHPDLQPLYAAASALRKKFAAFTLSHVRREMNKRADQIGNDALDGKPRRHGMAATVEAPAAPRAAPDPAAAIGLGTVHADAVECLRAAAKAWAANGADSPRVELVWDQLWNILADAGALKKRKG